MLLKEFFEQLSYGELSDLSIGQEGAGAIDPAQESRVASLTNASLKDLNIRAGYRKIYVRLRTRAAEANYPILAGSPDLITPFSGTVHKILGIARLDDPTTLEDEGAEVMLNARNTGNALAARIVGSDTVSFSLPSTGAVFMVEALVEPRPLTLPAELEEEVDVPSLLENVLADMVCARIFSAMGTETTMAKANACKTRIEILLAQIKQDDLMSESEIDSRDRLRSNGFV